MSAKPDLKSSVTRVFQRGITAFKAEDYPRAIQCFDQAFQASSNDSMPLRINILDSRAAAKEKDNDLKGSLSDSKKVIDMAPESPKVRASRLPLPCIHSQLTRKLSPIPFSACMLGLYSCCAPFQQDRSISGLHKDV
jgi:hypothetical protein